MRERERERERERIVCVDLAVVTDIIIYNYTDIILDPMYTIICIMRYQFLAKTKRLYIYIYALFI